MTEQLAGRALTSPSTSRLPADHPLRGEILDAHRRALDAGRDFYVDPLTGFMVMTAASLADRGECCDTGCRHCPYVA